MGRNLPKVRIFVRKDNFIAEGRTGSCSERLQTEYRRYAALGPESGREGLSVWSELVGVGQLLTGKGVIRLRFSAYFCGREKALWNQSVDCRKPEKGRLFSDVLPCFSVVSGARTFPPIKIRLCG